jgi:hypothetical protein
VPRGLFLSPTRFFVSRSLSPTLTVSHVSLARTLCPLYQTALGNAVGKVRADTLAWVLRYMDTAPVAEVEAACRRGGAELLAVVFKCVRCVTRRRRMQSQSYNHPNRFHETQREHF